MVNLHIDFAEAITTPTLQTLLEKSANLHNHLCPRQVLGVRMGLLAGELLQLDVPQTDKRIYTFVETDGCFADGVSVAVNCWLGRRTMRLIDYGKVAATFVDTQTGHAVRIAPHPAARETAKLCAPDERSRWHKMLQAYQTMPNADLLIWQSVRLTVDMQALISRAGVRVTCAVCGEEIINQREVIIDNQPVCRACAGDSYYLLNASTD